MTSEGGLWTTFSKHKPDGHWQRHEDKLGWGIPDVSYAVRHLKVGYSGWIELKECVPKRRGEFDIGLMKHQRGWLINRGLNGGVCWLLVQLDAYYWYRWQDLVILDVNAMSLSQHRTKCFKRLERLNKEGILGVITDISVYPY
jgi:hypothetical protein